MMKKESAASGKTRNRDVTNTSREGRVWKRTDEAVGQIDSVMGSETVATCFCFQWFEAGWLRW